VQGLLAGKLAVVTGASRGIGQAIAEAFAAESAHLVLTAEAGQEEELKKVLHTLLGQAFVFIAACFHTSLHTRTQVIKPLMGLPVAHRMPWSHHSPFDRSVFSPFPQFTAKHYSTMISTHPCFLPSQSLGF
jgi:hypothetical protein